MNSLTPEPSDALAVHSGPRVEHLTPDAVAAALRLATAIDTAYPGSAILGAPIQDVLALTTDDDERALLALITDLRPHDIGIDTPATTAFGTASEAPHVVLATIDVRDLDAAASDLPATDGGVVALVGQSYWSRRRELQADLRPVLLAASAVADFIAMQQHAVRNIGRPILVMSQHRSRGHQVAVIIRELRDNGGDLAEVLRGVALPGFSEHQALDIPAFDFGTLDGLVDDTFRDSPEYAWLQANAARYGFVLSYPDGNPTGIKSEPWHWRHEPRSN